MIDTGRMIGGRFTSVLGSVPGVAWASPMRTTPRARRPCRVQSTGDFRLPLRGGARFNGARAVASTRAPWSEFIPSASSCIPWHDDVRPPVPPAALDFARPFRRSGPDRRRSHGPPACSAASIPLPAFLRFMARSKSSAGSAPSTATIGFEERRRRQRFGDSEEFKTRGR